MKCILGTFEEQWEIDLPEAQAYPVLYVCPYCCQPWGMLITGQSWCFFAKPIPCFGCADKVSEDRFQRQNIPGSFLWMHPDWSGLDDSLLPYMSPALLQRELDLHIAALETQTDERSSPDCYLSPRA